MTTESLVITIAFVAIAILVIYAIISNKRAASKAAIQQSQIDQLESSLSQSRNDLQYAQQELSAASSQTNELNTQIAVTQQQVSSSQAEIAKLRDGLQASQSKITHTQEELNASQKEASAANARLEENSKTEQERQQQIKSLTEQLSQQRNKTEETEEQRNDLHRQLETLKTSLEEREASFAKQQAQLEEQKTILKKEFQNMANEILEAKGKAFTEQNKASLDALLNPFKEQLEGFRKRVDEVHTHQTEGNATLKAELSKLHELNQRITDEAANLTRALKGDKKKQGNWGELQVEMILDQSGLRKGCEYEREPSRKDEDNKSWRPDFIVNLPEGKHVVIDSKVSLVDYNAAVAAETDEERESHLTKHVQAVRKHINDLHTKDYSQLQGVNSPDFIFMFMPIEPAFIAAFEKDQSLFNNAFEKHIVVVTPTTLLATLRTIANLWSIERQNQSARVLAEQGGRVYDKLRVFVEKMDKLGNQLGTAQKTYDDAYSSLTGSRSLTSTVQKFTDLGVRVKKELPATVVESALLDDEDIASLEHNEELTEKESA